MPILAPLIALLVRFFAMFFIVRWVKVIAVLAAKIALFWLIWVLIKDYVFYIFGWVAVFLKEYLPSPNDPLIATFMKGAKVTQAWFPWEYLWICIAAIIAFKLWLIGVKLTVKIFGLVSRAVDWIMGGTSA